MDEKRTIAVNVKMKERAEWGLLRRAAGVLWPGAVLPRSAVVLGLALRAAREVLASQKPRPRP